MSKLLRQAYAAACSGARPGLFLFVQKHHWQVGDLLLWDNDFLLHRREPFPAKERRLMKRMTIILPREHHIVPDGVLAAAA